MHEGLRRALERFVQAAAVYRDPRMVSILCLGFSSGLPLALTFSTLSFWLKEEGLSNTAIGLFASVATPYSLKFAWAPLIDRASLPWLTRRLGRRRGWMAATQVALMASLVALGSTRPAEQPLTTAFFALVVAFCSASQDIVIDAYRVEVLEESQYAAGAAAIVFGYRIGMLVSGAGALFLASVTGWFEVYATMAALVSVGLVTVLLSREPQVAASGTAGSAAGRSRFERLRAWLREAVVGPLADFARRPGWVAILAFVMLYKFGDALAGVMTNPFLLELGFSKAEIAAIVKTYGLAATLAGAAAGGALMNATGMMRCLWICGLLQMLSNLTFAVQAWVGHSVGMLTVTIGLENLAGGMGTAAFVAYLSSLCNVSYTATQYALLTSVMSAARTWLSSSGGWLADHMSWPEFFALTTVAALPGLALLWWIGRNHGGPEHRRLATARTER
ncbi:MAG: MFS transporter [Candidatus Dadabacteria bacterium]|nr:MAG: MFS transporter [Candidatus Dadabacteria bacterium]